MPFSLQELADRAEPGPWKDTLVHALEAEAIHRDLWKASEKEYNRFYDTPEHLREALDGEIVKVVDSIEWSVVSLRETRDGLPGARDAAFSAKAAELGAAPAVDGEPVWIRLMRDLQALRVWRHAHLDGIDVQLAQFVLREPSRKDPGMFDRALQAWSKSGGLKVGDVRADVLEIARAGLLPGIVPDPSTYAYEVPGDHATTLADLVGRRGVDAVLAEVRLAGEILPAEAFPVPEEAIRQLEGGTPPRP
ncbi:hypothetical protein [Methylobacterium brachiatum]